jgi:uncharacterized protein (DUF2236 family)
VRTLFTFSGEDSQPSDEQIAARHAKCDRDGFWLDIQDPDEADYSRNPEATAGGLYRRDSVTWRVNRESALLLAGGRALLMQLAHPAVAAGVDEHSDFRHRPLSRLMRTLDLSLKLSFGDRREVLETAQAINRVHHGVNGAGYSALEPALLFWVQATLIDSALVAYETFVEPLRPAERDEYLKEAQNVGRLLGVPPALYPRDIGGFERYLDGMLGGTELRVDARARELAASVLRPPVRGVPAAAWAPFGALTAGLLPRRLREAYGLPWGRRQRAVFAGARWSLPRLIPLLPGGLRTVPQARSRHPRKPRGSSRPRAQ